MRYRSQIRIASGRDFPEPIRLSSVFRFAFKARERLLAVVTTVIGSPWVRVGPKQYTRHRSPSAIIFTARRAAIIPLRRREFLLSANPARNSCAHWTGLTSVNADRCEADRLSRLPHLDQRNRRCDSVFVLIRPAPLCLATAFPAYRRGSAQSSLLVGIFPVS